VSIGPPPHPHPSHWLLGGRIVLVTAAAGTGIGFAAAVTSTSAGSARPR